nr:rhomboid family intramembrane serine protease [uncultured Flavobacterium sp.]
MMNMTETVKQLIIINVIFFVGAQFIPATYDFLSLFYFESPNFKFWQPITHMFMHAPMPNLMHIFFNMFALLSFGSALEHFWGGKKFLFFYISCGLGAAALHSAVNYYEIHSLLDQVSNLNLTQAEIQMLLDMDHRSIFDENGRMMTGEVKTVLDRVNCTQEQFNIIDEASRIFQGRALGASGAIYGLLVAFAFMFPDAGLALLFIPIPIKAKYFVPALLSLDLYLGVSGNSIFGGGSGIAHFAHIGGALIGFIMMWYWKKNQFNKNRWN